MSHHTFGGDTKILTNYALMTMNRKMCQLTSQFILINDRVHKFFLKKHVKHWFGNGKISY